MTLCVTFERYLVVCWPLRARHLCTVGRAKLAVVVFCLFAVSYNVPRFFELTYRERPPCPECTRSALSMVSMGHKVEILISCHFVPGFQVI